VDCAQQLVKSGCTAIIAANDQMAMGTMDAVRSMGLSVPGDVSVAGYDDSVLASQISPRLTSVRIPFKQMITLAVRDMVGRIQGNTPLKSHMFKPELIVRDSTAKSVANV
jgi:DNA-binding LacI/PurR family transcriptional regulator